MQSDFSEPVNIGSEEMISINDFTEMMIAVSGKQLSVKHISGPVGVRGRNSDNRLIREKLGWAPSKPLREGVGETYRWIERSEEHTSELQSLMRISYAVFCLKKKKTIQQNKT